jgi:multidrug efflux pump subunit AcrB
LTISQALILVTSSVLIAPHRFSVTSALRRPYTFAVFSIFVLILGAVACIVTPKDIFPYINIPIVSVVWSYTGLTPDEMEKRIVTVCERAMTTTVNDIEHMQSESYNAPPSSGSSFSRKQRWNSRSRR